MPSDAPGGVVPTLQSSVCNLGDGVAEMERLSHGSPLQHRSQRFSAACSSENLGDVTEYHFSKGLQFLGLMLSADPQDFTAQPQFPPHMT
jgi:hypothetical protein